MAIEARHPFRPHNTGRNRDRKIPSSKRPVGSCRGRNRADRSDRLFDIAPDGHRSGPRNRCSITRNCESAPSAGNAARPCRSIAGQCRWLGRAGQRFIRQRAVRRGRAGAAKGRIRRSKARRSLVSAGRSAGDGQPARSDAARSIGRVSQGLGDRSQGSAQPLFYSSFPRSGW